MSILVGAATVIWGGALLCSGIAGLLCVISPHFRHALWGERKPLPNQRSLTVKILEP